MADTVYCVDISRSNGGAELPVRCAWSDRKNYAEGGRCVETQKITRARETRGEIKPRTSSKGVVLLPM